MAATVGWHLPQVLHEAITKQLQDEERLKTLGEEVKLVRDMQVTQGNNKDILG